MLRGFVDINKRACAAICRLLPQARFRAEDQYLEEVTLLVEQRPGQLILDIAAGRSSRFARSVRNRGACKIVGSDSDARELIENTDVDFRLLCDLNSGLPFADESIDVIVSRSAMEHLRDVPTLVRESRRVLKREGHCVHFFPCRYAPFALVNQALPNCVSRWLMHAIHRGTEKTCGFVAYYQDCYPSAFEELLGTYGLKVLKTHISYYQSHYFGFFIPLYLASAAYEIVASTLRIRNLCCYLIVVAGKS